MGASLSRARAIASALALAAGEAHAVLTDQRVETFRHFTDEIERARARAAASSSEGTRRRALPYAMFAATESLNKGDVLRH